jgi:site-specific DNA recombinase
MVTAKKGNHCGGVPPLGYDVDANAELVINEDEAEIVRTIFDMYELGYTYSKIAEKLNERGYKNKYGRPFVKTSFDSILRQEKYLGTYFWNRTRQKNSKHKRNSHAHKPKEQQVYLPDRIPSIISKEQFERVQKKLHDSQINRSKSRRHYMLSGLNILKCAECGSLMHGKITRTHGKEYETYFCPKHKIKECSMKEIRCDGINTLIATLLTDDICNRDDLQQICTMMNYNIEYVSAKSKLKGIEKSIQNLLKSLADGCPGEEVAVKLRELSADKKQLQKVITDYESSASLITPENIKEHCDKFKEMLITSNDPEIKQYLKNCIESINVDKDDVKIVLKVS